MNILFTCAGRRNYLINYFKEALNGEGKVFASDMQLTAPALVDADVALQVPAIYSQDYIPTLIDIVKKNQIHAVISLNDLELPILSEAKTQIESLGAKVIVSDNDVIKVAFDKHEFRGDAVGTNPFAGNAGVQLFFSMCNGVISGCMRPEVCVEFSYDANAYHSVGCSGVFNINCKNSINFFF